jgi:hypothetical protein
MFLDLVSFGFILNKAKLISTTWNWNKTLKGNIN